MSKPTTMKFGEFLIAVGNGAMPEVFTAPCGLTSKGFTFSAATADDSVPDCDDPDAPADKETVVTTKSRSISGSGVLAQEFLQTWDDWAESGLAKNCQVTNGGFVWTTPYVLTSFAQTADLGTKVKISVSLESSGPTVRTEAP